MKTIKTLSSLLLASAFLVGCSDDDVDLNSANCTVGFESTEVSVKENADLFTIPVVVEGEQNGVVNVTLQVEEYGDSPAKEDVNYYVTDKSLTISQDDKQIGFELRALDNEEINEARKFIVKIVSADGAKLDESKSTVIVTLKDNDSNFYEKFPGNWEYSDKLGQGVNGVKIMGYPEGHPAYNKELILSFDFGLPANAVLDYNFDLASKKMTLSLKAGQIMLENVNAGAPTPVDLVCALKKGDGYSLEGTSTWDVSEDFKTMKFNESNGEFVILVFQTGTKNLYGEWIASPGLTLTRK